MSTNGSGPTAPLRLSCSGTDTILALGTSYPNTLTFDLTNVSVGGQLTFQPGGAQPTRLAISVDVQPPGQRRDWALTSASEAAAITIEVHDATGGDGWRIDANQQGPRPEWLLTPLSARVLQPNDSLSVTLSAITSSLPEGLAYITVTCRDLPGFADTSMIVAVRKTTQCIAGLPISGGGTMRWDGPGGRFAWSSRFLAQMPTSANAIGSGYVEATQPTGDIPAEHVHDDTARPAGAAGVLLNAWEALYAVHDLGRGAGPVSYRIIDVTGTYATAGNWLLIAAVNGDDGTLTLGTGTTLAAHASYSHGSAVAVGTIMMWSGAIADIPAGWALCDGTNNTPDLRNRFVAGAGQTYSPGQSGGLDAVALSVNEMPAHQHAASSVGAGSHQHWIEGTNADGLSNRPRWIPGETTVDMDYGGGRNADPGTQMWRGRVNTDVTGDHGHSIGVEATGGGQPHENRPPFFALAFIMKV